MLIQNHPAFFRQMRKSRKSAYILFFDTEETQKLIIRIQQSQTSIFPYFIFSDKSGNILISNRLFDTFLHHIIHICDNCVCYRVAVINFFRKRGCYFRPDQGTIFTFHLDKYIISALAGFQCICHSLHNGIPSGFIPCKKQIALVVECCFIFFFRISNQIIIEVIGP